MQFLNGKISPQITLIEKRTIETKFEKLMRNRKLTKQNDPEEGQIEELEGLCGLH
jgi:hypothetical protein